MYELSGRFELFKTGPRLLNFFLFLGRQRLGLKIFSFESTLTLMSVNYYLAMLYREVFRFNFGICFAMIMALDF